MSDSDAVDAPRGPAYFDRLPVELIKRIVHFVDESDNAVGALRPTSFSSAEKPHAARAVDVANGVWSSAHVYGVRTLSIVNKQFRALTLPLWYQTIRPKALADTFFRFHILPSDRLRSFVAHLEISVLPGSYPVGTDAQHRSLVSDALLVDVAWTLPFLPNLKSLTIPADKRPTPLSAFDSLRPFFLHPEPPVWREFAENPVEHEAERARRKKAEEERASLRQAARDAWEAALHRIEELYLYVDEVAGPAAICSRALPATLKRLALDFSFFPFQHQSAAPARRRSASFIWENGLSRFKQLEKLQLHFPPRISQPPPLDPSLALYHMPTLTSLTLTSDPFGNSLWPFLNSFAPNLIQLSLSALDPDFHPVTRAVKLPRLRRLFMNGYADVFECLGAFLDSPLESVELEPWDAHETSQEHHLSADYAVPPTLRELRVAVTTAVRPSDAAFIAAWAEKGVRASLTWLATTAAFEPDAQEQLEQKEQARAVVADLAWAANRVQHLEHIGDEAGLQEMAEATRRIRERRILEEQ